MMVIGELPNELASLYQTPQGILRVAADAGLNTGMLVVSYLPPAIAWTWILAEAEQQDMIGAVIQAAGKEYPDNEILAHALQLQHSESSPSAGRLGGLRVDVLNPDHVISVGGGRFRYIPRGTAWIGSDDGYDHERPRHRVELSSFFLRETPVTNAEFAAFCDATGYRTSAELGSAALCLIDGAWRPMPGAYWQHPLGPASSRAGRDNHPVVQVNWYDASIYCRWLAQATGLDVTLPTETQWEYAASGPDGLRWPFGDTYHPGRANIEGTGTTPVRQFPPNAFGLHDMAGNVYDWCTDWYTDQWTKAGHELSGIPTLEPVGPGAGRDKILRGGSWFDTPYHCRCANRYYAGPVFAAANWGFRCCLPLTGGLVQTLISDPRWTVRAADMLRGV